MPDTAPTGGETNQGSMPESRVTTANHTPSGQGPDYDEEYIRWYCEERQLERPAITLVQFLLRGTLIMSAGVGVGYVVWKMVVFTCSLGMVLWVAAGITFIVCRRRFVIGLVKLYQHYAPDYIRRRCAMQPSCSEYCILAVEKYGVVRGCWKTAYRLTHKCRGFYEVDWP